MECLLRCSSATVPNCRSGHCVPNGPKRPGPSITQRLEMEDDQNARSGAECPYLRGAVQVFRKNLFVNDPVNLRTDTPAATAVSLAVRRSIGVSMGHPASLS